MNNMDEEEEEDDDDDDDDFFDCDTFVCIVAPYELNRLQKKVGDFFADWKNHRKGVQETTKRVEELMRKIGNE